MTTSGPQAVHGSAAPGTAVQHGDIVVGCDGSPASVGALLWACAEATRRHLALRLVQAVGPEPPHKEVWAAGPPETAKPWLRAYRMVGRGVATCGSLVDVPVASLVQEGSPAAVLTEQSSTAALVVVGARSRAAAAGHGVRGSVSSRVVMQARSPVVVVRDGVERLNAGAGVTVGVDGSADTEACLTFALEEASVRRTHLEVVFAAGGFADRLASSASVREGGPEALRCQGERLLQRVLARSLGYPEIDIRSSVELGDPVRVLALRSATSQLLVVGRHGLGGSDDLALGSVSLGLVLRAACPVAVIPASPAARRSPDEAHDR